MTAKTGFLIEIFLLTLLKEVVEILKNKTKMG